MKHKLAFLLAVFAATVLLLAVQKPVFWHGMLSGRASRRPTGGRWCGMALRST